MTLFRTARKLAAGKRGRRHEERAPPVCAVLAGAGQKIAIPLGEGLQYGVELIKRISGKAT